MTEIKSLCFLPEGFYPSFGADVLIAFLGAFLGIIGAYLLYLLSLKQVRRDRLKYVASLIESIVPSVIRQSQYCNEHAERIIHEPFENIYLKLEANRDPKRLADKVDQEGVYHAYLWKYKRKEKTYKDFRNLYGYIDYLDYLVDDLIRTNEKVLNATWERKKQYAISFKMAKETIQSLSLIRELNETQKEFVTFSSDRLKQVFDKYPEGENLVESFNVVVVPIRTYIVEKAKQHPKITELLFLLDDLFNQYTGIELSAKHNAVDYRWYSEQLKEKADELREKSKQLREDFRSKN
jgi:hypothetical protein